MHLGLPAPLFTIDMGEIQINTFKRFVDSLSPTFGHMISLGQSNTIVSCPALTTHSELDEEALNAAGLSPTTLRFAIGDEDPFDLIRHLVFAARGTIDLDIPNFSDGFMPESDARELVRQNYAQAHAKFVDVELQDCPGY